MNTVKPALSGVARDGQVVSTTDGTWTGTQPLTFGYQWLRCDSVTWLCTPISGATGATYTVGPADVGFKLQSSVRATNAAGQATASSYGSAIVAAAAPVNTVKPALSGVARDGQVVSTTDGTWTGTQPLTFGYQWLRCDSVTWLCTPISGATGATYTVGPADVGFKLQSSVRATNAAGQATASSYGSAIVAAAAPVNTVKPALSGVARDGQVVSTTDGTWTGTQPLTFGYQWLRCDSVTWLCTPISGATGATYTVGPADVGFKLQSSVRATNAAGQATASSYGSAIVAAGSSSSTFGTLSPGSLTDTASVDLKEVSLYSAPQPGLVSKLTGYVSGLGKSSGSQPVKAVLYADSGGSPGALLGVSNQVMVQAGRGWGWVDFTFASSVQVQAGSVWMGYIAGASSDLTQLRYDSSPNELRYNKNSGGYGAGPTSPFGTPTLSKMHYSLYATYTPTGAPPPPRLRLLRRLRRRLRLRLRLRLRRLRRRRLRLRRRRRLLRPGRGMRMCGWIRMGVRVRGRRVRVRMWTRRRAHRWGRRMGWRRSGTRSVSRVVRIRRRRFRTGVWARRWSRSLPLRRRRSRWAAIRSWARGTLFWTGSIS